MPREKFQTLTEQMFYILLCLEEEQCGVDIMARVAAMTVEDCLRMRKNVRRVFDENFDLPVVQARYAALLQGIV